MRLVSINLSGAARSVSNGARTTHTGIYKLPVPSAEIHALGLNGDLVSDKKNHGGLDQAVYLYSADEYAWWAGELFADLEPGTFGENLTLSSFGPEPLRIGDRFKVGSVLLEVTAPRIPCWVLADRMGDTGFVKKFRDGQRPGAYARVLEGGTVTTGDKVEKIPAPSTMPLLLEVFNAWYEKTPDPAKLRWFLTAPLAERARAAFADQLADLGAAQ